MAGLLSRFFLNAGQPQKAPVGAPAFSLTKVMAVVAPLITVLVTVATARLKEVTFTEDQLTVIIVALVAFLALTGSADVLARAVATSAEKRAGSVASARRTGIVRFETALASRLTLPGADEDVKVIAASDETPPQFLCLHGDNALQWHPSSEVVVGT